MPLEIQVVGLASKKSFGPFFPSQEDLQLTLMDFLRQQHIPIASSCLGEGLCKKCKINGDILSCQISTINFIEKIGKIVKVDYL